MSIFALAFKYSYFKFFFVQKMQWHELFIICKTFALIFFLRILAHLIAVEMGDDSLVMDRVPKIGY